MKIRIRLFVDYPTTCLALVLITGLTGCAEAPEPPPNILWITVEDMSPRLGVYGDTLSSTPHIDQLAAEGVRYTHAFSVSGVCAPSRAALITGMYPTSIGAHHMRTTMAHGDLPGPYLTVPPPEVKAFTEYLRAAGYYTTNNAKTDYQFAPITDSRQPVTAWDESGRDAHWRNRRPGQPFFAVFNSTRTHESRVWPDPDEEAILDPRLVDVPPYYPDTPVVRADIARHYDNIARVDRWVGSILAELEDEGLADSTIVFFFSDHGDGLPRAKRWIYDSGIRVPLIVRWPGGVAPGSVDDRLVSFVDFGPTVLSLAGVPLPEHLQGRPFLSEAATAPREYVFAARDRMDEVYDMMRAVRDGRYKYIRNFYPERPYVRTIAYRDRMPTMQELLRLNASGELTGPQALWFRQTKPTEELYDTQRDPHEIHNLADSAAYADVLARMRAELESWMTNVGDLGAVPEAEMIETMWPGRVQPVTATPKSEVLSREGECMTVRLVGETDGASIAYTTDLGDDAHWMLYTNPLTVCVGSALVRARAVRYGYRESEEAVVYYGVRG